MQEGDIDFCMYQIAVRHFRPPLKVTFTKGEYDPYNPVQLSESYIVRDDLEQQMGLFKVYQVDDESQEKHVHSFMKGISHISSLGLTNSLQTTPIDFELAKIESPIKNYIALFTIPEGKTLSSHIRYLAKQRSSIERNQALDMVKNGYIQTAKALGELHTKRFSPVCTISEYYWKFHMDTCRALVKSIKSYAKKLPFDLSEFSDKLIRLAAYAYKKPCSAAYLHGSPLAVSLNYEPFSGVLSLMDLENCYHSIDEKGLPCGPSAYDYIWAESSLELQMSMIDAPYDELQDVLYDYRLIYKDAMRERFASAHHLTFYSVLFWLPVFKKLVVLHDGETIGMNAAEKRIYELALSRVKAIFQFKGNK